MTPIDQIRQASSPTEMRAALEAWRRTTPSPELESLLLDLVTAERERLQQLATIAKGAYGALSRLTAFAEAVQDAISPPELADALELADTVLRLCEETDNA